MRRRRFFFKIIFIISFSIIALKMSYLSSIYGEEYRQASEKISRITGQLAAIRGRIYDENDQLLAWSQRCYDLVFHADQLPLRQAGNLRKALQEIIPQEELQKLDFSQDITLKSNLSSQELEIADALSNEFPALEVALRWERHYNPTPLDVGEVIQLNGIEVGISGLEKQFDDRLRGKPGTFTVMLDLHGRWVNSSFCIIEALQNGEDIYLAEDLEVQDVQ